MLSIVLYLLNSLVLGVIFRTFSAGALSIGEVRTYEAKLLASRHGQEHAVHALNNVAQLPVKQIVNNCITSYYFQLLRSEGTSKTVCNSNIHKDPSENPHLSCHTPDHCHFHGNQLIASETEAVSKPRACYHHLGPSVGNSCHDDSL